MSTNAGGRVRVRSWMARTYHRLRPVLLLAAAVGSGVGTITRSWDLFWASIGACFILAVSSSDRAPVPPRHHPDFDTYDRLLRFNRPWLPIMVIYQLAALGYFVVMVVWGSFFDPNGPSLLSAVIATVVAGVIILVLTFVVGVWYVAAATARDIRRCVHQMACLLLGCVPRPYDPQTAGLAYADIKRLQRMAQSDQASAAWRTANIAYGLIGAWLVGRWGLPYLLRLFSPTSNQSQQPQGDSWLLSDAIRDSLAQRFIPEWLGVVASVAFVIVFATYVASLVARWIATSVSFLASTTPNRIVVLGCEEALSLLEKYDLQRKTEFSLRERHVLVSQLHHRLLLRADATLLERQWGIGFGSIAGRYVILPDPVDFPVWSRISDWWRGRTGRPYPEY